MRGHGEQNFVVSRGFVRGYPFCCARYEPAAVGSAEREDWCFKADRVGGQRSGHAVDEGLGAAAQAGEDGLRGTIASGRGGESGAR